MWNYPKYLHSRLPFLRALCHKPKLCVTNPSSVPQNKALCHKTKQTIQEFGTSRNLVLLHKAIGKTWVSRRESKALCHKNKANYPRIRHKPNNAKSTAFCSFCVFAGKNAVSLTNQGCKGCQNVSPLYFDYFAKSRISARHRGSRDALAPIKPWPPKSPKPKPQTAGIKGENAYRDGNRQTVREFGEAEFSGFGTRQLHKRWLFRCQNVSPLYFYYFAKSRISLLF